MEFGPDAAHLSTRQRTEERMIAIGVVSVQAPFRAVRLQSGKVGIFVDDGRLQHLPREGGGVWHIPHQQVDGEAGEFLRILTCGLPVRSFVTMFSS